MRWRETPLRSNVDQRHGPWTEGCEGRIGSETHTIRFAPSTLVSNIPTTLDDCRANNLFDIMIRVSLIAN
jgi:hypothetical protein